MAPSSSLGSRTSSPVNGFARRPDRRVRRDASNVVAVEPHRAQDPVGHDVPPGLRRPAPPPAGRAGRSRGWSSGDVDPGRRRSARGSPRPAASHDPPGTRSHHGPVGSAVIPLACASSRRIVASAYGTPGRCRPSRSSSSSRPVVPQPHHRDGGERLGDRRDPVRPAGLPQRARPVDRPSRDVAGHQPGQPALLPRSAPAGASTGVGRPAPQSRARRRQTGRGSRRPGCGRRTPGRSAPPAASTCRRRVPGRERAVLARVRAVPLADDRRRRVRRVHERARRRARRRRSSTAAISARIAIIASQNRSSSARLSDSVGSIMNVPGTGKLIVGAWKP